MAVRLACAITPSLSKETAEAPTDEKGQKTCKEASEYLHRRITDAALDSFKKADKQNGGHCLPCHKKMIKYGMELRDWKTSQRPQFDVSAQPAGMLKLLVFPFTASLDAQNDPQVTLSKGIRRTVARLRRHANWQEQDRSRPVPIRSVSPAPRKGSGGRVQAFQIRVAGVMVALEPRQAAV